MKKITIVVAALCATTVSFGQSWSDDFESYNVGDYLAATGANVGWRVWSGQAGGGQEDVMITNADASSGTNALFFDGQANGGPQDIVLVFPELFEDGTFHLDFNVKADSGFYMNLQGALPVGSVWVLDFIADANTFYPTRFDGVNNDFYGQYDITGTGNAWHNVSIDVNLDLTENNWVVKWDGQEVATFTNTVGNAVGALNIYPLSAEHDFFVDDVAWSHTPSQLVTFKVDMTYYLGAFTTPEVNGDYNGWCGACNVLEDGDGDGIWEGTFLVLGDSIEYKYAYDNWTGQENLLEGEVCTKTTGEFTNRFLLLDGSDVVLDPVCWEQCDECDVPTGVKSRADFESVSLYPNPTTDIALLEFAREVSDMTVRVIDATGRDVVPMIRGFSGNKLSLPISGLPKGIYFIDARNEQIGIQTALIVTE